MIKKFLKQFVKLFLLVREKSLVKDVEDEFLLEDDQRVKVFNLVETIEEDSPCGFENFNQYIVVNISHEVRHLIVSHVEFVELALKLSVQPPELLLVRHCHTPIQA